MLSKEQIISYQENGFVVPEFRLPEEDLLEIENKYNLKPKTGKFGSDMKVELENDGPVTIIIDTKNK